MKMNKVLQGTLVIAAATATWLGVSATDASAATTVNVLSDTGATVGTVSLNLDEQTLTFARKGTTAKEVLFGVGAKTTVKVPTETGIAKKDAYKVAAWDVHDITGTTTTIDLSKLSNTKDNYIEIKTDVSSTPVIIKIPAVAATNVVTYDASTNILNFKAGAKKTSTTAVSSYQFRTAYGSWSEAAELDETGNATDVFADFQYQGATLYLRTPGVESADIVESETVVYDTETLNAVTVQETSSLPGKETKLTIAKQANGPKVTVNYLKAILTFAKGTEWRLITSDSTVTSSPDTGYKNESVATFLGDSGSGMLEVRTAKVTGATVAKSKCASKWTRVAIEAPVTLTDLGLMKAGNTTVPVSKGTPNEDGSIISYGDAGVKNAVVSYVNAVGDNADAVTAAYATTTVKKVATYTKVVLTNAGTDAYQVIVVAPGGEAPAADASAKTLKAATAKGASTLTLSGVADGSTIYIRKAGVAASKTWVGAYEALGVVDYPKTQAVETE